MLMAKLRARFWSQSDISIIAMIGVYQACVLTVLLYGCDTNELDSSEIKFTKIVSQSANMHHYNSALHKFRHHQV